MRRIDRIAVPKERHYKWADAIAAALGALKVEDPRGPDTASDLLFLMSLATTPVGLVVTSRPQPG